MCLSMRVHSATSRMAVVVECRQKYRTRPLGAPGSGAASSQRGPQLRASLRGYPNSSAHGTGDRCPPLVEMIAQKHAVVTAHEWRVAITSGRM